MRPNLINLTLIIIASSAFITFLLFVAYHFFQPNIYAWYFSLPQPKYRVFLEQNIMIPVRDNVQLATDIYRPKTKGAYPVILMRTPYSKENPDHNYPLLCTLFASQGYVVLVQDVRGKFGSEGNFYPLRHEAPDGDDTINWICKQDWSDGKVGMLGISYLGSCAWLAASCNNPHLKTIIPMFTTQNTYQAWMDKGVPYLKDLLLWTARHLGPYTEDVSHEYIDGHALALPISELAGKIGKADTVLEEILSHTTEDDYWKTVSVHHQIDKLGIPSLFISGWYDRLLETTIDDFLRTKNFHSNSPGGQSRLIIGPWGHNPVKKNPDLNIKEKSADFRMQFGRLIHWFDVWLKDRQPNFDRNPISLFMTGKNKWISAEDWPLPGSKPIKLLLNGDGSANGVNGKGRLSLIPTSDVIKDEYIYDPANPAPSIDGKMYDDPNFHRRDRHEGRDDILVYTTPVLDEDFDVAGTTKIILYISSSAPDTDFVVKVSDVRPDNYAHFVQSGFVRMRYFLSEDGSDRMEPDKIYRVEINLGSICHSFLKNHRIRLKITSSDFPGYSRNLNTGGNNETGTYFIKARQVIFHGGEYDSHLLFFKPN